SARRGRRGKAKPHPLGGAATTVGREPGSGLVVDDGSVSRLHARLDREGARLWVTDLKSANGTFKNGEPVLREELEDGDEVTFGEGSFEVARRDRFAWAAVLRGAGVLAALVVLGLVGFKLYDSWRENSLIQTERKRIRAEVVASLRKGMAAFREGNADY